LTAAQLEATSFRVRVTDVSSSASKDFRLDSISVQVS
jgi:hypothetical protein